MKRFIFCIVLPLLIFLVSDSYGAGAARHDDFSRKPRKMKILMRQDVVMDVLPIAVIYAPPGKNGEQTLKTAKKITTKTTLSAMTSRSTTTSIEATVEFVTAKNTETDTCQKDRQSNAWKVSVNTSQWEAKPQYDTPGDSDVIAYYARPKFQMTFAVGERVFRTDGTEVDQFYPKPVFVSIQPIMDKGYPGSLQQVSWIQTYATVHALRYEFNVAKNISPKSRTKLLALDPFAGNILPAGTDPAREASLEKRIRLSGKGPDYLALINREKNRFTYQNAIVWVEAKGWHMEAGQQLQNGSSVSSGTTHSFKSITEVVARPKFNVNGVSVSGVIDNKTEFTFKYSAQRENAQVTQTEARAVLGGGDLPEEQAPVHQVLRYYDETFCTLLFPSEKTKALIKINRPVVIGKLLDSSGRPVANTPITVQGPKRGYLFTATDSQGNYKVALDAGHYEVGVGGFQATRFQKISAISIPSGQRGVQRLAPVKAPKGIIIIESRPVRHAQKITSFKSFGTPVGIPR